MQTRRCLVWLVAYGLLLSAARPLPRSCVCCAAARTANSAAITGEDNLKGSIEAGKLADFVVLSHDLLNIPIEEIKQVRAVLTVVGGKEVFQP